MNTSLIILVSFFLIVGGGAIFISFVKSHHFVKVSVFSIFTGVGSLMLVHFTSLMTGFSLPVNIVSLLVSAVGGVPGVLAMSVIKFI